MKLRFIDFIRYLMSDGITIGELYDPDSKNRKAMALKYKLYRSIGINQELKAFHHKCAFCLTPFSKESIYGVHFIKYPHNDFLHCHEEHRCPTCKQKWSFLNFAQSKEEYDFLNKKSGH